jgi:SAM-dependent methyltransferase
MKRILKQVIPFSWRARLRRAQQYAAHAALPLRAVTDFGQLRRLSPVSTDFGIDRGQPIDRYYIDQFLDSHSGDVRGHVLDVNSDSYASRYGGTRLTKIDVVDFNPDNPSATIIADLGVRDSLPAGTFDCIICTQTLLLIYDVHAAIANLHQALKAGGVLLVTVPGVAHKLASDEPSGDFWRFTSHSAKRAFGDQFGIDNVEVTTFGNVLAATAFLHGLVTDELEIDELEAHDPDFEVTIAVRAVKR